MTPVEIAFTCIHTVNARDNVLLEVAQAEFKLDPAAMFAEIQGFHRTVAQSLLNKGIQYGDLRNALVPSASRLEAAFVFDTQQIESGWYGYSVHDRVLPLFDKRSTCSVLHGDFLGPNESQHELKRALGRHLIGGHPYQYLNSHQFYIVYVNNLSPQMLATFHGRLNDYKAYVGYLDMTFGSPLKYILSTFLGTAYLLRNGVVVMGHEEDRDEQENVNILGYSFEKNGFEIRSVSDAGFGVFLEYKIERPVLAPEVERDTELSLNAITDSPANLLGCAVRLDVSKLDYLVRQKSRSLSRVGFVGASATAIAESIRQKLATNYIYNLCRSDSIGTMKFNVLAEMPSTDGTRRHKVTIALEYLPLERCVRVITMY